VKGVIAIVLLVGAISLTGPASSHHSDADRYHFVLPLSLALEAACEADASVPNKDIALGPIFNFDSSGAFLELVKTNPDARHLAAVSNAMPFHALSHSNQRRSLWLRCGLAAQPVKTKRKCHQP
jgi:hypothetical protein